MKCGSRETRRAREKRFDTYGIMDLRVTVMGRKSKRRSESEGRRVRRRSQRVDPKRSDLSIFRLKGD